MKKSDSRLFKGLSSMDFKYIEKLNALLLGLRENIFWRRILTQRQLQWLFTAFPLNFFCMSSTMQ
jgi:hypothetical protein